MALVINHNLPSLSARRSLDRNYSDLATATQRLSSGLRINYAWDDPAGLAVSEKFRAQIDSMVEAERNANYGINMLATAEGGLSVMDEKLTRMRALAVEASSGVLTTEDRAFLNVEFQQLKSEITRIAEVTNYNGLQLLDGTYSSGSGQGVLMQVGTYTNANEDYYTINLEDMTASGLGLTSADLTTTAAAQAAITTVDSAISTKDTERTRIGSFVERLQYTISNLQVAHENAVSSESTIRDADIATESSNMTRAMILAESSVAMLAQVNDLPRYALALL